MASLGGQDGVWSRHSVTIVNAVPTLVNIMTSLGDGGLPSSIRLLNLGGEACPPALVDRLHSKDLTIINTYGPTETTVTATYDTLLPGKAVTIGTPLPSYHCLILPIDEDDTAKIGDALDITPGVEGQLCIGGPCVGKGYVGRPELTAAKFIRHPLFSEERLYLTGDRVRLDDEGKLIFLGRIDTQVKHRGFRIELGEIESVLAAHEAVQVVAVICARAGSEDARLEAYVVLKEAGSCMVQAEMTRELQQCVKDLPGYMRPEQYIFKRHDELPRLASGKVNLNALHAISNAAMEAKKAKEAAAVHIALDSAAQCDIVKGSPLDIILRALRETFPQAANMGAITPSADFFCDIGGHSLTAALVVSKIRKQCLDHSSLKTIGLSDIYTYRTPELIAKQFDLVAIPMQKIESISSTSELGMGDYMPVTNTRYVLCAICQIPALLIFSFLNGLGLLTPYWIFEIVYLSHGFGMCILATYGTFVLLPILMTVVGVLGKWIVLGRARAGRYPLYGVYYYR